MAMNGMRIPRVIIRLDRYKNYMTQFGADGLDVVEKYKDRVLEAAAPSMAAARYVAGDEIRGESLRQFSPDPIIAGPLVCQLCEDAAFVYDADFATHKESVHAGENEYRKRVLFLMEQSGCRPITGQEKRIFVGNFAHFQQFSRPGAKGNTFARISEVPRCEAACALCQRKAWIEYRHKLNLFGEPQQDEASRVGGAAQPADAAVGSPKTQRTKVPCQRIPGHNQILSSRARSTICSLRMPCMKFSMSTGTRRVGLSYQLRSCMHPAWNTLSIQTGGGCCTSGVFL